MFPYVVSFLPLGLGWRRHTARIGSGGSNPLPEEGEAGFRVEITCWQRFIRLPNGCSATGVSRGEQLLRFSLVLCAFARENAVGTQFAL